MSAVAKADVRDARQRAGQIRQGIHNYLETLALIAQAWQERDWETLGYDSWDQYIDTEFSEARLRLPADHREKAVRELRLTGMSQRAIGSAMGIPQTQVSRDLAGDSNESPDAPATATGLDGKSYARTQPARRTRKPEAPVPTEPEEDEQEQEPVEPPSNLDRLSGLRPGEVSGIVAAGLIDPPPEPVDLPVMPSPAVTEFLGKDESLQRAHYLHEFMKVLTRSDDFMEFEPEKLAEVADLELVESLTSYLTRVSNFVDRFQKARKERGGLRVLNGGRR